MWQSLFKIICRLLKTVLTMGGILREIGLIILIFMKKVGISQNEVTNLSTSASILWRNCCHQLKDGDAFSQILRRF